MVFCIGGMKSIKVVANLFNVYAPYDLVKFVMLPNPSYMLESCCHLDISSLLTAWFHYVKPIFYFLVPLFLN